MDRLPFAYVAIAVVLGIAVLAGWLAAFRYLRQRPPELSSKDKMLGFMLAGPFFGLLHSSLSSRGYQLTRRETLGLLFVAAVVLTIIVGAIVHGYAGT